MEQFSRELGAALEEATMQVESESGGEGDRSVDAEATRCKRRSRRLASSRTVRMATTSLTSSQLAAHLSASQLRSDISRGRIRTHFDGAHLRSQQASSHRAHSSSKFGSTKFRNALMSDDSDSSLLESSMCHSLSEQTALGGSSSVECGHGRNGQVDDTDTASSDEPCRSAFATHFSAKRFRKRPSSAHRRKLDCYYMPTVNRVQSNVQKHRLNAKGNSGGLVAPNVVTKQSITLSSPKTVGAMPIAICCPKATSELPTGTAEVASPCISATSPVSIPNSKSKSAFETVERVTSTSANFVTPDPESDQAVDTHRCSTATIVDSSELERLVDEPDARLPPVISCDTCMDVAPQSALGSGSAMHVSVMSELSVTLQPGVDPVRQLSGLTFAQPSAATTTDDTTLATGGLLMQTTAIDCLPYAPISPKVVPCSAGTNAISTCILKPTPIAVQGSINANGVPNVGFNAPVSIDCDRLASGGAPRGGGLRSIVEERSLRTRKRRRRTRLGRRAASTDDDQLDVGESSLSESSGEDGVWSSVHRSGDDRDADDEQEQSDFWYAEPDAAKPTPNWALVAPMRHCDTEASASICTSRGVCGTKLGDPGCSTNNGDLQAHNQSQSQSQQRTLSLADTSRPGAGLLLFNVGEQNQMTSRLFKTGRRCCTHDMPRLRFTRATCSQSCSASSPSTLGNQLVGIPSVSTSTSNAAPTSASVSLCASLGCRPNAIVLAPAPTPLSIFGTQLGQFETLRTTRLVNLNLLPTTQNSGSSGGAHTRQAQLRSHSSAGLTSQSSFEHIDTASKRRKNEESSEPSYHHDTSSNADNSPSPSHLVVRTSMEL